ncbi:MAG: hypothetical protein LCH53_06060 [Bacteroidetes bacterium]|nr:hypothetical protein [Bacteroidota bacterium]
MHGIITSVYYLLPDRLRAVPIPQKEVLPFLGDYVLQPDERAVALYRLDGFAKMTFADSPVFRYCFDRITIGPKPPRLFPPGIHGEVEEID